MGIKSFAEMVGDGVKEQLGSGYHVTVNETVKNNGVVYTGLCVKEDGASVAPLIYLESYYEAYKNGSATLEDITEHVADTIKGKRLETDIMQFLDYESAACRIVYKLVNTEKNKELLGDIPHKEYLDLSIVFQYVVADEAYSSASILIRNVHMKLWGVSVETLFKAAEENTPQLRPFEFKGINEAMRDIIGNGQAEGSDNAACAAGTGGCLPLYVLSNSRRMEGAACILYPALLKDISDRMESSFYIIPSSLHETLVLPADNTDGSAEIRAMIKEINDTQVKPEEVLSYSLYYYDREEDRVSII